MSKTPIALQLYSVRADCAYDLPDVLENVAKMGYDGVEFAGFHGHSAADIKKVLDRVGLKAAGTHTGLDALADDKIQGTIADHHTLGAKFVIIPWLAVDRRDTPEACAQTATLLTKIEETIRTAGLVLGFHAHDGDMKPLSGGRSAWDILAEGTPTTFAMQYDTANGMAGGADPVQPILDWPGRSQTVHLKEWRAGEVASIIGKGEVPWARVFEACSTVGSTEWYVVEYEGWENPPAMEAVATCLTNLRAMGV